MLRPYYILTGASSIQYSVYFYITRTDFTYVNCPGRVRAGDAFYYSDDALLSSCHSRARARDPIAHHLATESRLRPSFLRSSCAGRRFFLRSAAEPMTYSGRPPRPRPHRRPSSAVQQRYVSSTLTNMSDIHLPINDINLALIGTHYSARTVIFSSSEARHRTV